MRRLLAPAPPSELVSRSGTQTFSVIVAAYQVADVIGEALESVRAQTLPPHEVIVCDDGSTDGLSEALKPFAEEIRVIAKEHGGEASAKNAAAAAASGEFVVILDADDTWFPERLQAIAEVAAARPDLDIITTDAYLAVDGHRVRRCYSAGWTFAATEQRRAILQRNFIFGHPAVRRELLLAHGGFDESILWTTDWECWIRLILDGARAGCAEEALATYRVRENSLSARREDLLKGKITTLRKTRAHPALEPHERRTLERTLAGLERELAYSEARASVAARDPAARARARAVALGSGHGSAARLRAAAWALAPGISSWLIRRNAARWWTGAGGTRVRREQPS